MSREGALWIGGLEQYMDEEFLMNAFRNSGEDSILSIKVSEWYTFINHVCKKYVLKELYGLTLVKDLLSPPPPLV